jgi:hypothetical protein
MLRDPDFDAKVAVVLDWFGWSAGDNAATAADGRLTVAVSGQRRRGARQACVRMGCVGSTEAAPAPKRTGAAVWGQVRGASRRGAAAGATSSRPRRW